MADFFDTQEDIANPLDSVEEILAAHNWTFNRMNDDELIVEVSGKSCNYRLFFIWQSAMNAMQFCCQYDIKIPEDNFPTAAMTLMGINENIWMGHFDLPHDTRAPSFRHTCLFRGVGDSGNEHLEDMVDIALVQCERYYPVFFLLSTPRRADNDNLALALMETAGES